MTASIVDQVNEIANRQDFEPPHEVRSMDLMDAICSLADSVVFWDDAENGPFGKFADAILKARCDVRGSHTWEHDHCGYWGHQYCSGCRVRRYPEIPARCSEAMKQLGKVTEAEYRDAIAANQK